MLNKKQKAPSPELVETTSAETECTCAAETEGAAAPVSSPTDEVRSASRHWSDTRGYKLLRKISFTAIGLLIIGLFCRNAINHWLSEPGVDVSDDNKRIAWMSSVEKMSAPEALAVQTQLQLRARRNGRSQSWVAQSGGSVYVRKHNAGLLEGVVGDGRLVDTYDVFGEEESVGDVFGDDTPEFHERGLGHARLAVFYAARKQYSQAIAALEQSLRIDDAKKFNPSYESWRWMLLRDLYLQEGDYQKAAQLLDKLSRRSLWVRAPDGDDLHFHQMAKDVFTKVGWKEKADQQAKLAERARLMPKKFFVDDSSTAQYLELRRSKFKYATIAIAEDHPQEAVQALMDLVTDKEALRTKIDHKRFLAVANMMLPVAQVEARDWTAAGQSFPRALRLAAAEVTLESESEDAKPALYDAYAKFLEHKGESGEAEKYRQLSRKAEKVTRPLPAFENGKRVDNSILKYDDRDLYPPELMK